MPRTWMATRILAAWHRLSFTQSHPVTALAQALHWTREANRHFLHDTAVRSPLSVQVVREAQDLMRVTPRTDAGPPAWRLVVWLPTAGCVGKGVEVDRPRVLAEIRASLNASGIPLPSDVLLEADPSVDEGAAVVVAGLVPSCRGDAAGRAAVVGRV